MGQSGLNKTVNAYNCIHSFYHTLCYISIIIIYWKQTHTQAIYITYIYIHFYWRCATWAGCCCVHNSMTPCNNTLSYIWRFMLSFTHAFISQLVMTIGPLSRWEEYALEEYANSTGPTVVNVYHTPMYEYTYSDTYECYENQCEGEGVRVWGWQVTRQAAVSMLLTCIYGLEAHTKWQQHNVTLMCHQSHTHIHTHAIYGTRSSVVYYSLACTNNIITFIIFSICCN